MDVLRLLGEQQATNRANFAQSQADRAELSATRPQQQTAQGRDANSGTMAISSDGDEARLIGARITSGLIKPGQSVRVNADGGTVTVDQKPASRPRPQAANPTFEPKGNVKLLFRVNTPDGVQLWVCGWKENAELAFTVPKGATIHTTTLDNLGGDDWSLNLSYRFGNSPYTIAKISNSELGDWELSSAQSVGVYGHGFWQGSTPGTTSGGGNDTGVQVTGNSLQGTLSRETTSYSVTAGGSLFKIWEGELTSTAQLGSSGETGLRSFLQFNTVVQEQGSGTYDEFSTLNIYAYGQSASRLWGLPALLLTNNSSSRQTLDQSAEAHTVEVDYQTVSSSSTSQSESIALQASLEYSLFKINAGGTAGLGRRQTHSSSATNAQATTSSNTDHLVWFGAQSAEVETEDFPLYGVMLDVFADSFTTQSAVDADPDDTEALLTFSDAYLWDTNKTLKLATYSNEFALLEEFEVSVFKADLDYPDNQPPIFQSVSYHP